MEYIFLIIGITFGLFIGAQIGADYITKRLEEIDKEIEINFKSK